MHKMWAAAAALSCTLSACVAQECAYYNDCPAGQYCAPDAVCVDYGPLGDQPDLGPGCVAGGCGDEDEGPVLWAGLSAWLNGAFGPAGTFADDVPGVYFEQDGFGTAQVAVTHTLADGATVFAAFSLPEPMWREGAQVAADQVPLMGCVGNVALPDAIDVPADAGTVRVRPEEDGVVRVGFDGEFTLPSGEPGVMAGEFLVAPPAAAGGQP